MFQRAGRQNLGLIGLFLDNQSKNMLQICKTMLDDAGRIPLHLGVICLPVHRKLQSVNLRTVAKVVATGMLALLTHCELARYTLPRETAAVATIITTCENVQERLNKRFVHSVFCITF